MALGQLPPWLDVSPALYLKAIEAGSSAGIGLAKLREDAAARADALASEQSRMAERQQFAREEADQNRELRRDALAQQLGIATQRGDRADRALDEASGLKEARLGLDTTRMGNLQDYRTKALLLREAALELARQRENPEFQDPYANDIEGAPGVKEVIDSRGKSHIVNPGWMEKLLSGTGALGQPAATNAAPSGSSYRYVPGKGLVPITGG